MAGQDLNQILPWDRQPGETTPAYAAFASYRDMGHSRSNAKVARELGKSVTIINRWSSQWRWVARTEAWDSMPGRETQAAFAEVAARIAAQHERVATKLLDRLERNLDLMVDGTNPPQTWTMAHGAARQGHQLATDLARPKDTAKEEITRQISALIERLAGGDPE